MLGLILWCKEGLGCHSGELGVAYWIRAQLAEHDLPVGATLLGQIPHLLDNSIKSANEGVQQRFDSIVDQCSMVNRRYAIPEDFR
jgi:hypothetical protein